MHINHVQSAIKAQSKVLSQSTLFRSALLGAALLALGLNQTVQADSQSHANMSHHVKAHGGEVYQFTQLESKWLHRQDADAVLKSEWLTWIGTDENKLFVRGHTNKVESSDYGFDVAALYSRNVAEFWDVQGGIRYRYDQNLAHDRAQYDAVLGLYGMAPYYFETESYLYVGQDQRVRLSIEAERDLLITQKLITQPHLSLDVVFNDDSKYAQKTGLSEIEVGLETRYEITRKFMPFVDVSYAYQKGDRATAWQAATDSKGDWQYGVGLRLKF